MKTYVIIGPLSVSDLSAVHPDIVMGYPSATAVAGLGYKIVLNLAEKYGASGITHEGTAVIIHDHSLLDGHPKNPVPGKDPSKGAPIVDEFRARAEVSFVISIANLLVGDAVIQKDLFEMLPGLLFSGGKIFPMNYDINNIKNTVKVTAIDKLKEVLSRHKSGTVLFDRHDLLDDELLSLAGDGDALDALLNCIEYSKVAIDGKDPGVDVGVKSSKSVTDKVEYVRKYQGWLVPQVVGFQAIERPQLRSHSRTFDGVNNHVYAETLYSLAEYKSLAGLLKSEDQNPLEGSFWKHTYNPKTETYYVTGN